MRTIGIKGLCLVGLVAGALAGCGGGGGSSDSIDNLGPRLPQATVVRDDNPTAPRMALGPADFLPVSGIAQWVFDRLDDNGQRIGGTTMEATAGGGTLRITESEDGQQVDLTTLRLDAGGWVLPDLGQTSLPAGAVAVIGEIVQYPQPFHGLGTTRVQYRSGNYGADIDGDGVNESFEFQFRQTMVGFESVAGPSGPVEALHIREELLLTVIPSRRGSASLNASATSDDWLAPGAGFVRSRIRSIGSEGRDVFPPYTLALMSARIDGVDPLDTSVIRQVQTLDIVNRDLIFDAARGVYYASVPGSVLGQGNRIAIIDAATGGVRYSGVVGSDPGVMALAADGASLYVALDGSSELVRLALPELTEMGRMRLPADANFGLYVAESLAASPVDPQVVAISLAYTGFSPTHAGVLLVRNLQPQLPRTQGHTGSNLIVFGADGQSLFGFNNESTEFGLRRIELLNEGLSERQVLYRAIEQFYLRTLDRNDLGLVLGNRMFSTADFAPLGQISGAVECRALRAQRLACVTSNFDAAFDLLIADAATATVLARLHGPTDSQFARRILVAGPAGQLAVRDRIDHPARTEAARILLLRHPALP